MAHMRGSSSSRWWTALVAANVVTALAGGVFGVIGMTKPETMVGFDERETRGTRFFAGMYGVRAVAIAAVTSVLMLGRGPGASVRLVPVLSLAAAVQLADVGVALKSRTRGSVGAGIASFIHVASLIAVGRSGSR